MHSISAHSQEANTLDATPYDQHLYMLYQEVLLQHGARISSGRESFTTPLKSRPAPLLDKLYDLSEITNGADLSFSEALTDIVLARSIEPPLPIVSSDSRAEVMSRIKQSQFTGSLQQFTTVERMEMFLERERVDDFTFVALSSGEDKVPKYTAYCLAYMKKSLIFPDSDEAVLYIGDIIVANEGKLSLLGIRAFREVLTRAAHHNIRAVELRARQSTAYRAFNPDRPIMRRLLTSMGYEVTSQGEPEVHGEGESQETMRPIRLERIESQ